VKLILFSANKTLFKAFDSHNLCSLLKTMQEHKNQYELKDIFNKQYKKFVEFS